MTEEKHRFEVVIYNRIVRELVERDESHKDLKDEWADNHYQVVKAANVEEARLKMETRYPAKQGFVIAQVIALDVFDGDDEDDQGNSARSGD